MAQKKQPFRFRIPWLSGALPSRPVTKYRSKSPTKQDTIVPIQRPPEIAPPVSAPNPTQTEGTPRARAEPQQQQSPSRPPQPTTTPLIIESPETSQSESSPSTPTPPSPTQVSKPAASSASEQEKEKEKVEIPEPMPQKAEPKVKSPLTTILKSPEETSFQPERMSTQPAGFEPEASSVPSSPISETEPAAQPQPSSPLASDSEGASKAAEETTLPASPDTQKDEGKMAAFEPVSEQPEPKMKSPLKTTPKSPETSSQTEKVSTKPSDSEPQAYSVPSTLISKTEPASQPQSSSPLASERTREVFKPTSEETSLHTSPTSQQEKGKMAESEALPQGLEPKMKSPLKTIPKSPLETSSQPVKISTQPTAISGEEKRSTTPKTKKLELDAATGNSKAPLEARSKLLQSEEKEKVGHQHTEVGEAKENITGQQIRQTKDLFARAFQAEKKQEEARGTVERKMMFSTSNLSGKDIKVVSSSASADPETRNVSSNEEKAPLQKGIKDDISKFVHKLSTVHPAQPMDERAVSVITLAGDNRGAKMHIGSDSAKREGSIHIQRAYKTNPEESAEVTTDEEETSKEGSYSSTQNDEQVEKAYINSNIQSINNSLMFHGSVTERDPGVQLILPQKEPSKSDVALARFRNSQG